MDEDRLSYRSKLLCVYFLLLLCSLLFFIVGVAAPDYPNSSKKTFGIGRITFICVFGLGFVSSIIGIVYNCYQRRMHPEEELPLRLQEDIGYV